MGGRYAEPPGVANEKLGALAAGPQAVTGVAEFARQVGGPLVVRLQQATREQPLAVLLHESIVVLRQKDSARAVRGEETLADRPPTEGPIRGAFLVPGLTAVSVLHDGGHPAHGRVPQLDDRLFAFDQTPTSEIPDGGVGPATGPLHAVAMHDGVGVAVHEATDRDEIDDAHRTMTLIGAGGGTGCGHAPVLAHSETRSIARQ